MMKSTTLFITVALLAALLLSACNPVVAPGTTEPAADAEPAAAEAQAAAVAALSALPWQWVQVSGPDGDSTVETPEAYTLLFNADGTLAVTTACEQRGGTYAVEGTALTISLDAADGAACPDDAPGAQLVQLVGEAGQFFALGDTLVIVLADGASTLSFKADVTTVLDLCGAGAAALNPIEATLPPAVSAGLDAALLTFLDAGARSAPGVAMLVVTPAGRYFKAAGVADVTTCAPLAADIPYEIGSNTKLMTSAMILQLQEEGALAIDDPIADYLPELAATLPYGDAITIDMLLRHTSGLYDYFDVEGDGGPIADGTKDKAMLTRAFTPEELVQRVAAAGESYFAPEEAGRFHYSNTGYILLGLIIEKVTGKTYAENLQARILDPLGLTQTFLLEGQPAAGLLPRAYYSTPFAYTTDEWNASQGWSAGAVVSTAEEFARFLKALFTGQLFQDAATLDLMRGHSDAGVDALGSGMTYGRGMLDIQGVLGHGGQTLGFQSDGGYLPDDDITIVMWSNSATSNVTRIAVPALVDIVRGAAAQESAAADSVAALPDDIVALQAAYGPPSQAAFGSAAFYEPDASGVDLADLALAQYKVFVGDLWDRYGEDAWMGPWKEVYARPAGGAPNIVTELRGIDDADAALSTPMILDVVDDADAARAALAATYDDPAVTELRVFTLGDGEAMTGLLVAGRRGATGEATFLVFLMD